MSYPIVDLKRSEWDREKSKPENGEYVFTNKIYYKNKDFREGHIHPFKIKWCKYSEQDYPRPFATLHKWKLQFKAEVLTLGDDYWPESFVPDAEGKYVEGDLICVKIPIEEHVKTRQEAVRRSEMQAMGVKKQFSDDRKREGADIPEEWMEKEKERVEKEGFEGV
ncbi:MAG: hypothetical protein RTV72_17590 [Candidatus Thorarchaeota archaeon]